MDDEIKKDVARNTMALRAIVDGRHPQKDAASILVTADQFVAGLLLTLFEGNVRMSEAMLKEVLIPNIEKRFAMARARLAEIDSLKPKA